MQIRFVASDQHSGIPVKDSHGHQQVLITIQDGMEDIVVIADDITGGLYINRIKNRFLMEIYESSNFEKIEDEEQFNKYLKYLKEENLLEDGKQI